MTKLIELQKYRQMRRQSYLKKNEVRIERFVQRFVANHFKISYSDVAHQYLAQKTSENEASWDYQDFRDVLKDAVMEVYGEELKSEIKTQFWFDSRWLSLEEMVERCTRHYILCETAVANL